VWFIAPAWIANGSPAIFGGGKPIDGGRNWRDGRRLLGDGKTWRGFVLGVSIGTLAGIILALISPFLMELYPFPVYEQYPLLMAVKGFTLAFGTLLGDLLGSFVKRRFGIPRGEAFWGVDQLGFFLVAYVLTVAVLPWTLLYLPALILLIPMTFAGHVGTNLIWYALGRKKTQF
jgi:CDP-2,3-bis-(O-geranylgeranyl)-sn-glycerol synthase